MAKSLSPVSRRQENRGSRETHNKKQKKKTSSISIRNDDDEDGEEVASASTRSLSPLPTSRAAATTTTTTTTRSQQQHRVRRTNNTRPARWRNGSKPGSIITSRVVVGQHGRRCRRFVVLLHCSALFVAVVWLELRMFASILHHQSTSTKDSSATARITTTSTNNSGNSKIRAVGQKQEGQKVVDTDGSNNSANKKAEGVPLQHKDDKAPISKPSIQYRKSTVHIKKPPPPTYSNNQDYENCTLLKPNDFIYEYGPWDASPIVIEEYKLVFFTVPKVGCTVFKQLFRRMERYEDWTADQHPLPHAPRRNGLTYLYDYKPMDADRIMQDPEWTKAIFVRNPPERLLSGYLDKGQQNTYMQYHCCPPSRRDLDKNNNNAKKRRLLYKKLECDHPQEHHGPEASQADKAKPLLSFVDFLELVVPQCNDPHWNLQSERIDTKYWSYINFVGHFENLATDTRLLLQRIGAWELYGATGWPNGAIFEGGSTARHATGAGGSSLRNKYFQDPNVQYHVQKQTQNDYAIHIFNFTRNNNDNSNIIER